MRATCVVVGSMVLAACGGSEDRSAATTRGGCGNGVVDGGEVCDGDCPTTCDDGLACTVDAMVGSATDCTAACTHTTIRQCVGGDACCPTGCTGANDSDCSSACGNGVVNPGEKCDGNCPATVADCPPPTNACTRVSLSGSAAQCTAECTYPEKILCADGDGCCASVCSSADDSDCSVCGNGIVERGETCDGSCPTTCPDEGDPCTTESFSGAPESCDSACAHTPVLLCDGVASDGCCPSFCSGASDVDCQSCTPDDFCSVTMQAECGTVSGTDSCGTPRVDVSCGTCDTGYECNATFECTCAINTQQEICDDMGAECGVVNGTDSCGNSQIGRYCGLCPGGAECLGDNTCACATTPQAAGVALGGPVCSGNAVDLTEAADGAALGIDGAGSPFVVGTPAGVTVTGCQTFDFGGSCVPDQICIKAWAGADNCSGAKSCPACTTCTCPLGPLQSGTVVELFASGTADPGDAQHAATFCPSQFNGTGIAGTWCTPYEGTEPIRYVTVCRGDCGPSSFMLYVDFLELRLP